MSRTVDFKVVDVGGCVSSSRQADLPNIRLELKALLPYLLNRRQRLSLERVQPGRCGSDDLRHQHDDPSAPAQLRHAATKETFPSAALCHQRRCSLNLIDRHPCRLGHERIVVEFAGSASSGGSFLPPRWTTFRAPSGKGFCSDSASSRDARSQTSRSSSVRRMTGIAFG